MSKTTQVLTTLGLEEVEMSVENVASAGRSTLDEVFFSQGTQLST